MTVRLPGNFGQSGPVMSGMATLEYELMAERAHALGHHGRAVEKAIAALKNAQGKALDTIEQEKLLDDASEAVWGLFVHRETCGLRNDEEVIKDYDIPKQVLARLGAKPRHR